MSTSAVGSLDVRQLLQQARSRGGQGLPQPTAEQRAQFEARFNSAAKDAGIDTEQFAKVRGQIDDAVKGALDSFDGSGDPRQSIESAINGVLKDNGIDADEFKSKLKQVGQKLGLPDPSQSFGGAGPTPDFSALLGSGERGQGAAGSDKDELLKQLLESIGKQFGGNLPAGALVDAQA